MNEQSKTETHVIEPANHTVVAGYSSNLNRQDRPLQTTETTEDRQRPITPLPATSGRSERPRRHVRLFCFSCNRYESHSIAARNRILYSFLIGVTFWAYYYLGKYACHCCGSARMGRFDWINPQFWYRSVRFRDVSKKRRRKVRRKKNNP